MSLWLLLLACLLTCLGQVAQKCAVENWRGADLSWSRKWRSPWLWLALFALGSGLLVWLLVLQRLPVSVAYPMLSLNFVIITLIARFVFKEPVDVQHWFGVLLVIGGVALLGQQS